MICNKITYGGETILTIYHTGFDKDVGNRQIKKSEKIGKYNLTFHETTIFDNALNIPHNYKGKFESFISPKSNDNPYRYGACAYMEHYVFSDKPKKIFKFVSNEYILNISINDLNLINDFVEQYAGLRISNNPIYYGDIIKYKCYERNYRSNKSNGIIVNDVEANTTIIVRFKDSKNSIVSNKIEHIDKDMPEVQIISDNEKWNYHDIEIYKNNDLIYLDTDISYIRNLQLSINMQSQEKPIKLNALDKYFLPDKKSEVSNSFIGEPIDDSFQTIIHKSNYNICNAIRKNVDNKKNIFLQPNELNKAMDIITKTISLAADDIWIFDSYFSDKNGLPSSIDLVRILSYSRVERKNIIFCAKESSKAYSANELRELIQEDDVIKNLLKSSRKLNISFYQSLAPIHDRFIIYKNVDTYAGIAVGTSFNSLNGNYYCIHELEHIVAKTICESLVMWLQNNLENTEHI